MDLHPSSGTILDNGADWQVVTPDGVALIDTRYLLRLDDDALAYLQTRGFGHGPAEVLAAVAAGEPIDPHDYFFRVYMTFETASGTYGWLNRAMAIGSAMRLVNTVIYDAYLIR
jgi:FAD/FMN-containing dehydrogenase